MPTRSFLTRGQILENGSAISAVESDWEALDGVAVALKYTVKNTETGKTSAGDCTLNFSAIARTVTTSATRSQNAQTLTVLGSDLRGEDGWYVSAVDASGTHYTAEIVDGNVLISIPAGVYADEALSFTLAKDGESKTYSAKINVQIEDVNWAPTWADGSAAGSKTHAWGEQEKDDDYTLDVKDLVTDYDTAASEMTYAVKADSVTVTDTRTGYSTTGTLSVDANTGVVTFSPEDADFFGTVTFTISVTDKTVGTAAAQTSDFAFTLTISNVPDAPVPVKDANFTIKCAAVDKLNFTDLLKDQFRDPDESPATITVTYNGSAENTAPTEMGVYVISVTAADKDGNTATQDVTLRVSATATIEDASLDTDIMVDTTFATSTNITGELQNNYITTQEVTFNTNTVLAAGTKLSVGTTFSAGAQLACSNAGNLLNALPEGWTLSGDGKFVTNTSGAASVIPESITRDFED